MIKKGRKTMTSYSC